MTREEAKQASDWFRNRSKAVTMPGAKRMYLLAIEALSAQPDITLESAIGFLHDIGWMQKHDEEMTTSAYTEGYTAAESKYRKMWDEMPKIIRCKDCKHRYDENKVWTCPFGLPGGPEFFCGYGAKMEVEHETD